jgi:hypothetical protein
MSFCHAERAKLQRNTRSPRGKRFNLGL